jgi:hypothetical protein
MYSSETRIDKRWYEGQGAQRRLTRVKTKAPYVGEYWMETMWSMSSSLFTRMTVEDLVGGKK